MSDVVSNLQVNSLNALKQNNIRSQRRGLPFIVASVIIWSLIAVIQLLPLDITTKNLYTFFCSPLLMPIAFITSKIIKADIFGNKSNPLNSLGFIFTINQMLYLLIVMWAFSIAPGSMLMIYAMVFSAHLLPFGWLYNSKSYTIISVIATIAALIIGINLGNFILSIFMMSVELILAISLGLQNRLLKD